MISFIGWLGAIAFALCAVPQAHKCYKQKHAHGVSYLLLLLWIIGEVLTLIYVLANESIDIEQKAPLLLNYFANLASLLVIIRYRVWPTRKQDS